MAANSSAARDHAELAFLLSQNPAAKRAHLRLVREAKFQTRLVNPPPLQNVQVALNTLLKDQRSVLERFVTLHQPRSRAASARFSRAASARFSRAV